MNRFDDMKYYNYLDTFDNEVKYIYKDIKTDIGRQIIKVRTHPDPGFKDWLYFFWIFKWDIAVWTVTIAAFVLAVYALCAGL